MRELISAVYTKDPQVPGIHTEPGEVLVQLRFVDKAKGTRITESGLEVLNWERGLTIIAPTMKRAKSEAEKEITRILNGGENQYD